MIWWTGSRRTSRFSSRTQSVAMTREAVRLVRRFNSSTPTGGLSRWPSRECSWSVGASSGVPQRRLGGRGGNLADQEAELLVDAIDRLDDAEHVSIRPDRNHADNLAADRFHDRGVSFSGPVASFQDPNIGSTEYPNAVYQVRINWGDGSSQSTGAVTRTNPAVSFAPVYVCISCAERTPTQTRSLPERRAPESLDRGMAHTRSRSRDERRGRRKPARMTPPRRLPGSPRPHRSGQPRCASRHIRPASANDRSVLSRKRERRSPRGRQAYEFVSVAPGVGAAGSGDPRWSKARSWAARILFLRYNLQPDGRHQGFCVHDSDVPLSAKVFINRGLGQRRA